MDKDEPYLVYCQSGRRSTRAVEQMKQLGFTRLFNFAGSMNEWDEAKKPVEKGK
jgi:rhodanese-related sulfurtransferase